MARRFARREHPDVVVSHRPANDNHPTEDVEADRHEPLLCRVWIIDGDRARILEHGDCVRKSNAVFLGIGVGLLGVPLKRRRVSVCTNVHRGQRRAK
jgi:hypothetical protein